MSELNNVVPFPSKAPSLPGKDPWCSPIETPDGKSISGAAAREHRIKNGGGLNNIIIDAAQEAAANALAKVGNTTTSTAVNN